MNKTIHELNSLAQAQADDEFIIYDVSENESKKIQVQNLNNPNYSTTEQKTGGTWIDGKPIYRKTLDETFNTTTSDTLIPNTSGLNVDSIVSSDWYVPSEKIYLAVIKLFVQNGSLYIRSAIVMGNIRNLVTIEYTKTTD